MMNSVSQRFLAASLAVLGVVSFFSAANAEDTKYDEQLVLISGSYDKDRFQELFPVQQKVNGELYQFYLKNPNPIEASEVLPLIQLNNGVDGTIRAVNNSDQTYFLTVPSQNIRLYVPLQSERAVNVDISQIPSGKSVTYFVENASGEKVAGGYILNGDLVKSAFFNASAEQHSSWSQQLQQLIVSNEYKPPYFAPKPEPRYYKSEPVVEKKTVRGYW